MSLSPQDVARRRYSVAIAVRVTCLLALVVAGYHVIMWVTEGVRDGDFADYRYYYPRMWKSLLFVALGAGLRLFEQPLARFLIPPLPEV